MSQNSNTILTYPNNALFKSCRDLTLEEITSYETLRAIDRMFNAMYSDGGVGLAAPQVDWPVNVFIMNAAGSPDSHKLHGTVFINPRITTGGKVDKGIEGCLSFPSLFIEVQRFDIANIEFSNIKGERKTRRYVGWEARIIQHEFDHLCGRLFIDRVEDKNAIYPELLKLKKISRKGL